MNDTIKKFSSFILILALVSFGWPANAAANDSFSKGGESSEQAAGLADRHPSPSPLLRNLNGFHFQPDSTETVLFEEEEERNLVKEITVWVIGAAFVGYFIIKVFLEGDEEEPAPDKPKKEIPGSDVSFILPSFSF
jgi:hypothetical protein